MTEVKKNENDIEDNKDKPIMNNKERSKPEEKIKNETSEHVVLTELAELTKFIKSFYMLIFLIPSILPVLSFADIVKFDFLCTEPPISTKGIAVIGTFVNIFAITSTVYWIHKIKNINSYSIHFIIFLLTLTGLPPSSFLFFKS